MKGCGMRGIHSIKPFLEKQEAAPLATPMLTMFSSEDR
jgi:hypothetical protein